MSSSPPGPEGLPGPPVVIGGLPLLPPELVDVPLEDVVLPDEELEGSPLEPPEDEEPTVSPSSPGGGRQLSPGGPPLDVDVLPDEDDVLVLPLDDELALPEDEADEVVSPEELPASIVLPLPP